MYLALKHFHMTCALISILFFSVRGFWMLTDSQTLHRRWVRIVPHLVDTLLLASAIALTLIIQQYPLTHGWLTAKVLALLGYIGLGTIALKRGKTKTTRAIALALALVSVLYIAWVARAHYPWPWLI